MKYLRIQTDTRGASWIYLGLVAVIADAVETTRCVDAEVARLVRMTTLINVYTPITSQSSLQVSTGNATCRTISQSRPQYLICQLLKF